ncbi:hypothetical protein DFQ26_008661 [Actinomortierella ambigua]|nr:hypothetical protein DFQ26_008661 [Actinomortierella ambigua]
MFKQPDTHHASHGPATGDGSNVAADTFMGWAIAKGSHCLCPVTFEPRPMGKADVDVAIRYSGICGSDIHAIDKIDCSQGCESGASVVWNDKTVPGHEIAGIVIKAGPEAKFKVGERVGAGVLVGACLNCKECNGGNEQLCKKAVLSYATPIRHDEGDKTTPIFGGFANRVRLNSDFVYCIPPEIELEEAATLMCSGLTAYTALRRHGAGPNTAVGVMGIGSLGHLTLQFAKAMGCKTILALNEGLVSCEDCLKLGATKCFCNLREASSRQQLLSHDRRESLDLLVVCSFEVTTNWHDLLHLMKPRGTIVMMAMPPGTEVPLVLPTPILVRHEIGVVGSFQGGRREMREMFDFVIQHKIHPWTVKRPMAEINDALDCVKKHKVCYSMVLEVPETTEGFEAERTTTKLKQALEEEVQQLEV